MMTETVDRAAWNRARLALLEREKAHTRARDALAAARRALPRVRIDKEYRFVSERGEETLGDLFEGRGQLVVFHFMFGPDWAEGCPSCSFWADTLDGTAIHLAHRDTTLVLASRAPFERLDAYRRRMGWSLRWVSSGGSDFNRDFGVSFDGEERATGTYNYRPGGFPASEAHGLSVFARDPDGSVYHTYSAYGRGIEEVNGAYGLLDLTAKGRDEANLTWTMAWLRRHDQYGR
jgi:predicted dithiol-disulfide oxidoreductase (DUF899 family)